MGGHVGAHSRFHWALGLANPCVLRGERVFHLSVFGTGILQREAEGGRRVALRPFVA